MIVIVETLNLRLDDVPYLLYLSYTCVGLFWLFCRWGVVCI